MISTQSTLVLLQLILLLCHMLAATLELDAIYYGALLLLPLLVLTKKRRGCAGAPLCPPKKERMRAVLPFLPWILLLTVLTALLSSFAMRAFGIEPSPIPEASLPVALLRHALLPAILEELFFRYLPMVLLPRERPRTLVLISSLFFALAHLSLYQLPYALVAGVLYMTVALYTESVLPCMLLHFCNNALSVLMMLSGEELLFWIVLLAVGILLLGISLYFLIKEREEYAKMLCNLFPNGERITLEKSTVFYCLVLFLLTILFIL